MNTDSSVKEVNRAGMILWDHNLTFVDFMGDRSKQWNDRIKHGELLYINENVCFLLRQREY